MACLEAPRLSPILTPDEFETWKPLLDVGKRQKWKEGQMLIPADTKCEGLYISLSGAYMAVAYGKKGQVNCLWIMGAHCLIGEIAMLTGKRAIYNMQCQSCGETIYFKRDKLLNEMLPANPGVSQSIMRILAQKLRMQSVDVLACKFIPAKMRLAIFLLQIFQNFGNPIKFGHTDLADFLGIHRVTVTNSLSYFRSLGWVDTNQKEITIINPTSLEEFVYEAFPSVEGNNDIY